LFKKIRNYALGPKRLMIMPANTQWMNFSVSGILTMLQYSAILIPF